MKPANALSVTSVALTILLNPTGLVLAQEAAIEEVVVTATKRGEATVQDLGFSITAIGEEQLRVMNVTDFEDFAYQVPGLTFLDTSPGERRYVVRGIQSAGQQQVAVYYDEVPLPGVQSSTSDSGSQTPDLKLFDMERVEVLRGPQGTTFGANSQAGTVRFILNKPKLDQFELSGGAEFSHTSKSGGDNFELNGMINLPIIEDELALRFVAYGGEDGGYIDNRQLNLEDINSIETSGLRATVRWAPSDTFTLDGMFWYQDRDLGGDSRYHPFDTFGVRPGTDQGSMDNVNASAFFETGEFLVGDVAQTFKPDEQTIYSVTGNWELPFGNLTATGSRYERDFGFKFDSTWIILFLEAEGVRDDLFPALTDQRQSLEQDHLEIRLSSSGAGPWSWVAGGFYRNRESDFQSFVPVVNEQGLTFDPGTPFTGPSDEVGAGIPGCHPCVFARVADKDIEETAIFGEVNYEFNEQWEATVGVRSFSVDQSDFGQTVFQFALFSPDVPPPNMISIDDDETITKFQLAFHPGEDSTLYALRSQGFRLGGTNNQGIVDIPALFTSDELVNYELGWKTSWLDNRLIFNGAAFLLEWDDLQVAGQDPTGAFGFVGNAGEAEVNGLELELFAKPNEDWDFTAGLSYLPTRELSADQISDEVIAPGKDGDLIPRIPEVTFNLMAQYNYDFTGSMSNWGGYVRGEYAFKDDSNTELRVDPLPDSDPSPNNRFQDSYSLVNFRAGFFDESSGLDLVFFAENLLDERGDVYLGVGNGEPTFKITNRPRTIGFEINKQF